MPKKRYISFDLARGMMLLLVALAHAQIFISGTILIRPEGNGMVDTLLNYASVFFVDNRARAMFALLFGYGITLVIRSYVRKQKSHLEIRKSINRRAVALLIFGFLLSVVVGGKDILAIYGGGLLLIHWFLYRSDKLLERTMLALFILFILILPFVWAAMSTMGMETIFQGSNSYVDQLIDGTMQFIMGGPILGNFVLPVILSILIGVWFGRKGLLNEDEKHRPFLKKVAIGGIFISLVGAIPHALYSNGALQVENAYVIGLIFTAHMLTGIAGGCGYAALFGLIGPHFNKTNPIVVGITALGKRSLTFFIVNEILLLMLLSSGGLDLASQLSIAQVWLVAVFVWIFSIGMASVLEWKKKSGPFDYLFRRFVYR